MDATHKHHQYHLHRTLDLAQSHLLAGRPEVAGKLCHWVLKQQPDNLEAAYLLAKAAAHQQDFATAADLVSALPVQVLEEDYLKNYFSWHQQAIRLDQAVLVFRRLAQHNPAACHVWYYLAATCLEIGDLEGFGQAARRAALLQPTSGGFNFDLALLYERAGHAAAAVRQLQHCLSLNSNNYYFVSLYAGILKKIGKADEAMTYYRRLMVEPFDMPSPHERDTNYLMNFICTTTYTPEESFAEHRVWGDQLCAELADERMQHDRPADRAERLRIGYVSSDFCTHPVAFFIEPLLSTHDQAGFEVYLYSNVEKEDYITAQIQQRPVVWRRIWGKDDAEVCRMIRGDRIDLLIDLGGLTQRNRLPVFARKPAPVQVTWLGYAHSTGLSTMDYRMSDAVADPPGMTEHLHTEQLYRLPDCFLGYHPPLDPPLIEPLPSQTAGCITFIACNNLAKTNDRLLGWWAEILKQVPGSRLLMKDRHFVSDTAFREGWLDRFAALGITSDRLGLLGTVKSVHDHLAFLSQADIALDAYPYTGTTTTCETLWMGVPLITLAGPSHVSRVSASILTCIGVPELIAQTPDDYIRLAVGLADDAERLVYYRTHLRAMMQASPLMDFESFARKIEVAYREMWQRWCTQDQQGGRL